MNLHISFAMILRHSPLNSRFREIPLISQRRSALLVFSTINHFSLGFVYVVHSIFSLSMSMPCKSMLYLKPAPLNIVLYLLAYYDTILQNMMPSALAFSACMVCSIMSISPPHDNTLMPNTLTHNNHLNLNSMIFPKLQRLNCSASCYANIRAQHVMPIVTLVSNSYLRSSNLFSFAYDYRQ